METSLTTKDNSQKKKSLISKIWNDPVGSKVIATGILLGLGATFTYLAGWWPAISAVVIAVAKWMLNTTLISNWLLIILYMLSVIFVGLILLALITHRKKEPEWTSYTKDEFFGIEGYFGGNRVNVS